jgi:hypothetical protein
MCTVTPLYVPVFGLVFTITIVIGSGRFPTRQHDFNDRIGPSPPRFVHVMSPLSSPTSREWVLKVISDLNALGETYVVLLFLGPVPLEPGSGGLDWVKAKSCIGRHVAFGSDGNDPDELLIQTSIELNDELCERKLPSLGANEVVQYVQENLHWRIRTVSSLVLFRSTLFH